MDCCYNLLQCVLIVVFLQINPPSYLETVSTLEKNFDYKNTRERENHNLELKKDGRLHGAASDGIN